MADRKKFSIQLSDELMRALFFEWVTRNADADDHVDDPDLAAAFRAMQALTPAGIRQIATHAKNCMSITIDTQALVAGIYAAAADSQRADNLKFLITNGATRSMIADVLAVSDERIERQRDLLGAMPNGRGRPRMPSTAECEEIQIAWESASHLVPVEKYRRLRELFPRWSLASLSAAVNEFETKVTRKQITVDNQQLKIW